MLLWFVLIVFDCFCGLFLLNELACLLLYLVCFGCIWFVVFVIAVWLGWFAV